MDEAGHAVRRTISRNNNPIELNELSGAAYSTVLHHIMSGTPSAADARSGLQSFHPAVEQWFRDAIGEPTSAQAEGWAAIRARRHTLIAAPTGSGKTLAAFLIAIDDLLREGLATGLPDETRVIYVSPLKALSTDINKNLADPCAGVRVAAAAMSLVAPEITSAVRTGDTPPSVRAGMLRRP